MMKPIEHIKNKLINWLMKNDAPENNYLCDFDRIQYEIRPCDILLIEGRSRISEVIRHVTHSPWTHACIYIGRLYDIHNPIYRKRIKESYACSPQEQLIIESILGKGTVVSPLNIYNKMHIRICRPSGLSRQDAQAIINFLIGRLGGSYNVRHIFDLARFLLPWSFLPRKWKSSLFQNKPSVHTQQICSSMLAEAFASVKYPILPIIKTSETEGIQLVPKNHRLYTPSDFDYSPFFEIIKYPIIEISEQATYRTLPWKAANDLE